jgi:hypothetical protein
MKPQYIQILSIGFITLLGIFIVFLYAVAPRSLEEIPSKAVSTLESAATTGQVAIGTYQIDQARFTEGTAAFRSNNFIAARDSFDKADPAKRDAATQFYIAYSFYRQGWGRISNDDALFKQSLTVLDRVAILDPDFRSDDADLQLRTPAELRNELEEGMRVTADDFNPLKVLRERK